MPWNFLHSDHKTYSIFSDKRTISSKDVFISGIIGPIWSSFYESLNEDEPFQSSFQDKLNEVTISEEERILKSALEKNVEDFCHERTSKRVSKCFTMPGDLCMILRPFKIDKNVKNHVIALFIASHWKVSKNPPAERIMWFDVSAFKNGLVTEESIKASVVVHGSPSLVEKATNRNEMYNEFNERGLANKGKLKNNIPYRLYRMALYMDGFNPSGMNYDKSSLTGCYMAPLGLHPVSYTHLTLPTIYSV